MKFKKRPSIDIQKINHQLIVNDIKKMDHHLIFYDIKKNDH